MHEKAMNKANKVVDICGFYKFAAVSANDY